MTTLTERGIEERLADVTAIRLNTEGQRIPYHHQNKRSGYAARIWHASGYVGIVTFRRVNALRIAFEPNPTWKKRGGRYGTAVFDFALERIVTSNGVKRILPEHPTSMAVTVTDMSPEHIEQVFEAYYHAGKQWAGYVSSPDYERLAKQFETGLMRTQPFS